MPSIVILIAVLAIVTAGAALTIITARVVLNRKGAKRATLQRNQVTRALQSFGVASSGSAPVCAPLTDFDAPAVPATDVSAPVGRSSKPALAAAEPETVSP